MVGLLDSAEFPGLLWLVPGDCCSLVGLVESVGFVGSLLLPPGIFCPSVGVGSSPEPVGSFSVESEGYFSLGGCVGSSSVAGLLPLPLSGCSPLVGLIDSRNN